MAKVIWNKQAETEWRKRLLYGLNEFGKTTAIHYVQRTNHIIGIIRKHPMMGPIEPLIKGKKHQYRHFRLIGPLKLIYYYIESSDAIRIVDVWDSRREPKKLSKRIS